jgi:hypothetical protein
MTFSTYLSEVQGVRDEFATLAEGLPDVPTLVIVKRTNQATTYLKIDPSPTITIVPAKMVALFGEAGIQVGVNDFSVKGISCKYTEEQIVGSGISYLVGADVTTGVPVGGIVCNAVMGTIDNGGGLSWDMIITRKANR